MSASKLLYLEGGGETMPKKRTVIRVVLTPDQTEDSNLMSFVECLRYVGVVQTHESTGSGNPECFDILPPHGVDQERWATMNSERMRTFGFNSVDAPEWR